MHVAPAIGNSLLPQIRRQEVKQLIADKRNSGLSWDTVRNVIAPLREMLNHAVEDGLIPTNPASRVGRFNVRQGEQQQKMTVLTRLELRSFLSTAHQHYPSYYPFFLLLARAGLRLSEARALEWGDIDWQGRFIQVRRTFCRISKTVLTPKSGKARRVDMSRQLSTTLQALLTERKKETLVKGWREMPALVFVSQTGTRVDGDNLRARAFTRIFGKAGLRHIRIHDLRHTFASHLIQNGESLAYVRDQMGHHSIQVTVDTYGHLVPGGNREAVDRLDDYEEIGADLTDLDVSDHYHPQPIRNQL